MLPLEDSTGFMFALLLNEVLSWANCLETSVGSLTLETSLIRTNVINNDAPKLLILKLWLKILKRGCSGERVNLSFA